MQRYLLFKATAVGRMQCYLRPLPCAQPPSRPRRQSRAVSGIVEGTKCPLQALGRLIDCVACLVQPTTTAHRQPRRTATEQHLRPLSGHSVRHVETHRDSVQ